MLKILACLFMLIDHVGYTFFPQALWLRMIGRLAFPIFAYFIAMGFQRTRNKRNYFLRLFAWGVVAQIPFALLFHHASFRSLSSFFEGTNVLFTFCFAFIALLLIEKTKDRKIVFQILAWIGVFGFAMLAETARTDYGFYGVLTVVIIYVFKNKVVLLSIFLVLTGVFVILVSMHPVQLLAVFAFPLTWIQWPKQKVHNVLIKHAFYAFYPVHIMILWLIELIMIHVS